MNIIIPTTLIAVSIGAVFIFASPQYDKLKTARTERDSLASSIETIGKMKEKYDKAKVLQSAIRQEDEKRISEILPDTFDNVLFVLDLNNLATKNSIVLGPVDISDGVVTNGYVTHSVTVSFEAPYSQNAMRFLEDLEKSLTLFDVIDLKITANEKTMLTYSMIFNTYSLK